MKESPHCPRKYQHQHPWLKRWQQVEGSDGSRLKGCDGCDKMNPSNLLLAAMGVQIVKQEGVQIVKSDVSRLKGCDGRDKMNPSNLLLAAIGVYLDCEERRCQDCEERMGGFSTIPPIKFGQEIRNQQKSVCQRRANEPNFVDRQTELSKIRTKIRSKNLLQNGWREGAVLG